MIALASSLVSVDGARITFVVSLAFEKASSIITEFESGSFNASSERLFMDYWEQAT